ncbi:UDP-N-acetylmuramoyl-L-alanyl-D-glutamate--2,6-diaminopimelate ligase [Natranaerobius trueperi]|uniref:UDP-N-acetylmuramoyl-L-alanyl-D-glutamate--2, 6-diaminopimelate ligase n=1 Tax=Natranaerobius trueperi TaxID=759412 RepID=UPI0023E4780C|nr:UDP-N-acetylmuramoyl-L-alanyl-D-glutamate--2,6-diaminopimelate ligase [Natranaerobius trueperi]
MTDKRTITRDSNVLGISYDSRDIKKGEIFVCIKGVTDDGHNYIQDAIEKGASCIIVDKNRFNLCSDSKNNIPIIPVSDTRKALAIISSVFYRYPSDKIRVVAVTGTNGKTTTTILIDSLLSLGLDTKTALSGTVYNKVGKKTESHQTTTPESLDLQELLYRSKEDGVSHATIEVSSHAIDQMRVVGTKLDIAIFTNLTQDHLDYHKNMESYRNTKGKLFSYLGLLPEHNKYPKVAVINKDDPYSSFIEKQVAVQTVTYGLGDQADVQGKIEKCDLFGTIMSVESFWGSFTIKTTLPGKYNCYNLLAAITVALIEGVSVNKIQTLLRHPISIPGRFEKIEMGQNFIVLVDYAHTPDSLKNVLKSIRELVEGRLSVVFGCGGERDKEKREEMGTVVSNYCDKIFITNDNPRSEKPENIAKDIVKGIDNRNVVIELNRQYAIERALSWAGENDVVLISGKGHETKQIFDDNVIEFDDRKVARRILEKMGY